VPALQQFAGSGTKRGFPLLHTLALSALGLALASQTLQFCS
jgi:hypothetical protein